MILAAFSGSRAWADANVVVFADTEAVLSDVSYSVQNSGEVSHLICDLDPGDAYDVYRNGSPLAGLFVADDRGSLCFETQQGGSFFIARSGIQPRLHKLGVFRDGYWYLEESGNGQWDAGDEWLAFGMAGDVPVAGDFNGDGADDIAIYRSGYWYLDANGSGLWDEGDEAYAFGLEGFIPIIGKWRPPESVPLSARLHANTHERLNPMRFLPAG